MGVINEYTITYIPVVVGAFDDWCSVPAVSVDGVGYFLAPKQCALKQLEIKYIYDRHRRSFFCEFFRG